MYLILFILNDPEKLSKLLDSWEEVGVGGVTIMHSSGLGRVREHAGMRDDLPLIPSLESLINHEEFFSRTLFTVVRGEEQVEKIAAATQKVVGDLSRPNTGLMVAMQVAKAYGLDKAFEKDRMK
jgi:nitrogen regulatory protein PII